MPALAITDFTNLCGLVKFYGTGHGAGIKPIVGADFHVQCDLLGDEFTELTVLAANNTGYQNLTLLISPRLSARLRRPGAVDRSRLAGGTSGRADSALRRPER
ncbi:DNA polymerase III subunit alpha [Klebsiella pneumoniae]|uniref:DNA polymerase III subunit alpha n=1 Tax=Klebsiella pneumoniae TaxID=573 RepID=A0A2X3FDD6_KLEPN|nr:DNA polymerase III subunit alpha [Klebsiella pneumoniae]